MSVIARRIVSGPVRSAAETWTFITNLLASTEGEARRELLRITGLACSLISSEAPAQDPIVVWGSGPRVRIYCLFGEDAISGEDKSENFLTITPTGENWSMSLPCPEDDLGWVQQELGSQSKRITARKLGDTVPEEESETDTMVRRTVDQAAFFRL